MDPNPDRMRDPRLDAADGRVAGRSVGYRAAPRYAAAPTTNPAAGSSGARGGTEQPGFWARILRDISNAVNMAGGARDAALNATAAPAVRALGDAAADGSMQSWMAPLEGVSRAAGAVLEGQNPLAAAASQEYEYDENGNLVNASPTLGQALTERGVNPVLATIADMVLTPDPVGASRVTDLIPLLGLIGPAGLRAMSRNYGQVQWVPADILVDAAGNLPRRSPAEQTAFWRSIANDPNGIQEPVVLIYDPMTMRYKVGEGNHRALAAIQGDSPVPATVVRGTVRDYEGMALPPAGQQALNDLMETRHGYTPGSAVPGQLGLPFYDFESLMAYAARRQEEGFLMPLSDEEITEMTEILADQARRAQNHAVSPMVGPEIARPSAATPDHSYVLERVASDATNGEMSAEEYITNVVQQLGDRDKAIRFVADQAGLTPEEVEATVDRWIKSRLEFFSQAGFGEDAIRSGQEFDMLDYDTVNSEVMGAADSVARQQRYADPDFVKARIQQIILMNQPLGGLNSLGANGGEVAYGYERIFNGLEGLISDINGMALAPEDKARAIALVEDEITNLQFGQLANSGKALANQPPGLEWLTPILNELPTENADGIALATQIMHDALNGNLSPEDVADFQKDARRMLEFFDRAGYADNEAARPLYDFFASGYERLYPNVVGDELADRFDILASRSNELAALLDAGFMTNATRAEADELFAAVDGLIEDLRVLDTPDSRDRIIFLEEIKNMIQGRVDPIGGAE